MSDDYFFHLEHLKTLVFKNLNPLNNAEVSGYKAKIIIKLIIS